MHNKFTARFKKSAKSTVAQAPPPVSDVSPLSEGAYDYIRTKKNGGSKPPPYYEIHYFARLPIIWRKVNKSLALWERWRR